MKYAWRASAVAVLLAVDGSALAGPSISGAIPVGPVLFSDNSAEQWFDVDGSGDLSVGDRLRGMLSIGTIEQGAQGTPIGGQSAYNELTAIFDTVVTNRVLQSVDATLGPMYSFTFGASGQLAADFGVGVNTVGIFFEDSANDYAREGCGTYAACEATATGGDVWAELGVGYWTANNTTGNPALGAVLPLTTALGTFGFGLNFIVNNTGFEWNKVACADATNPVDQVQVDFCGQGLILATGRDIGGADTPYELFDDVAFTANRVPEPSSIALVGLALAGAGVAARRSKA